MAYPFEAHVEILLAEYKERGYDTKKLVEFLEEFKCDLVYNASMRLEEIELDLRRQKQLSWKRWLEVALNQENSNKKLWESYLKTLEIIND